MRILIDIPEDWEKGIKNMYDWDIANFLYETCRNGTPIPDNATNGDVIKAIFPNTEVDDYDYGKDPVIDVYGIDNTEYITLRKDWWNALYQSERR
jgi:hypothetical protein